MKNQNSMSCCHCWLDYRNFLEVNGQEKSQEWLDTWDKNKTCMAMDGHDGPHEWVYDSDIVVEFLDLEE